jgi:putative exosortase-associated protein (TIGR04073 family)
VRQSLKALVILVVAVSLTAPPALAHPKSPVMPESPVTVVHTPEVSSPDISSHGVYSPRAKLKRGMGNIAAAPFELLGWFQKGADTGNPLKAFTYYFAIGAVRSVGRAAAGVVEVLTFPFEVPNEGREPLIYPEHLWVEELEEGEVYNPLPKAAVTATNVSGMALSQEAS